MYLYLSRYQCTLILFQDCLFVCLLCQNISSLRAATLYSLFFFFLILFIYLFIHGCSGSLFPREGFLQLRQVGATLHRGARASHCRGLSCCGAQAPDAQAQQLWLTGLVAPRHVGSSQTRARTRVPCVGRQILNHCATREALVFTFLSLVLNTIHNGCSENIKVVGVLSLQ